MKKLLKGILIVGALLLAVSVWVYFQLPRYPYGPSHCCLKSLGLALMQYANKYKGHYPAGAGCPEASLSLLHREGMMDPGTLRGKTVPEEKVDAILKRGELLGPDSCGWYYVEGLTTSDNHRLALVWDKVGLGHNGQDLGGGHSVWFLDGHEEVIPTAEWSAFLKQQEALMAARGKKSKRSAGAN